MEISFPTILWELYDLSPEDYRVEKPASGHINQTFILYGKTDSFVLQRVNNQVFTKPWAIANNISRASAYLKKHAPDYLFVSPISNQQGELMSVIAGHYWRLCPYIPQSIALDVLTEPIQAYEAAQQFGRLSCKLNMAPITDYQITIPRFHDLAYRKQQFDEALIQANTALKSRAERAIGAALQYQFIVADFLEVQAQLPVRIAHHDTKISNVLLNKDTFKGICVIDLDTLMPGFFLSDLGDMMRTYLCAFDENEKELSKIDIREDYFEATIEGYLSEMGETLNPTEKELILFSGKYIIYMQALRFLSDYLQGSIYYPIQYPLHNLDRAQNQFQLLGKLFEKEKMLNQIIRNCLS